jgi:two-component system, chemotaxis family, response regulator Rcp1
MNMTNVREVKPVEILLVDDSLSDVRLTKEAIKEFKMLNKVTVARDGVEAMAFLHREGKYSGAIRPDLILLDLNMPRKDGRETLAEIKADPNLRRIPVVILTVSKAEEDVLKAYDLHANCYVTKPMDIEQFSKIVKTIDDFWFSIVTLPPNGKMVV